MNVVVTILYVISLFMITISDIVCWFIVIFLSWKVVLSQNGLLTTVAYKLGPDQPTVYALEVIAKIVIENQNWDMW